MNSLRRGAISLDDLRGVALVCAFSYADVLDSAKGWAGVCRYCRKVRDEVFRFYARKDPFSVSVCNGCQFMALLGKVGTSSKKENNALFVQNTSERYEMKLRIMRKVAGKWMLLEKSLQKPPPLRLKIL